MGGVSQAPFDSLNVGFATSDLADRVLENRKRLALAAGFSLRRAVLPRLIHGTDVRVVGSSHAGDGAMSTAEHLEADGSVTDQPGLPLMVTIADCVPLFLASRDGNAVGMLHAGWRGVLGGIARVGVARMEEQWGHRPADLQAAIGPSIGPCCFEVSAELAAEFGEKLGPCPGNQPAHSKRSATIDLRGQLRRQLQGLGVEVALGEPPCSHCQAEAYFSHRRQGGRPTGRMLAVIWKS